MLSSDSGNLTDALVKTKVLAFRLGEREISEWVTKELEGYASQSEVPTYRSAPKTVYGSVSDGYTRYPKIALPTHHLSEKLKEAFGTAKFAQSMSALEDFATNGNELTTPISPDFNRYFSENFDNGFYVEQAWGVISAGAPKQVVTRVRTRLLDFLLELSEKFPNDLSEDEVKEEAKENEIRDLFNKSVFGDNTTIVVGDRNTLNIDNKITKGDFNSLAKELNEQGLDFSEIAELKTAIEDDEGTVDFEKKKVGARVCEWLAKASSKTANTSLAVATGAGGNILATLIGKFYGF